MKKVILIILVLLIGGFFAFFDVSMEEGGNLEFLDDYKLEIGFSQYEAEQIFSTDPNEEGLRLTFYKCQIDSSNMKDFKVLSRNIGLEINQEVNSENEFKNIILVFKPRNENGIMLNEFMSIDELKFNYKAAELQ